MNQKTSKCKSETLCEKQKSEKLCPKHKKELEYYCQTCAESLCSDCLLELQSANNKHAEHALMKMCEKGKAQRKQLESYLQSLTSISKTLQNELNTLKQQQNSLHAKENDLKTRTTEHFLDLIQGIDTKYEQIRTESKTTTCSIHKQITSIQTVLEDSEMIINSSDPKVVPLSCAKAAQLYSIGYQLSQLKPRLMALDNKLTLPTHKFTVRIECFRARLHNIQSFFEESNYIYSDTIECFRCKWRAKIYPNGTAEGVGTHLGVFVELVNGAQNSSNFTYQLKIVAPNPKIESFYKNFTTRFNSSDSNDSSDWTRIISIQSVTDYLDSNGTLTMDIFITPLTYCQAISQNAEEYQEVSRQWKQLKELYQKARKRPQ